MRNAQPRGQQRHLPLTHVEAAVALRGNYAKVAKVPYCRNRRSIVISFTRGGAVAMT